MRLYEFPLRPLYFAILAPLREIFYPFLIPSLYRDFTNRRALFDSIRPLNFVAIREIDHRE